jgi:preprotein translocase subunit Sec61beta
MAKDTRVNMPTSTAGLVRYFDDYKSKIELKPGHVVVLAAVIMIMLIILHTYGGSLLGMQ